MARVVLLLALGFALAVSPAKGQSGAPDPDLAAGIRLVEDGEFDAAILALDGVARRLVPDPSRARELSQAYLYLGIAYVGKGHEAAAKAKFREAVMQMKDLSLSPEKYPPKVINLFEAAKAEAALAPPAPVAEGKPGKGHGKTVPLLIGGGALAAGAAAVALSGGSGGDETPAPATPVVDVYPGLLTTAQSAASIVVGPATSAGPWTAEFSWSDGAADIHMFVVDDRTNSGMGDVRLLSPVSAILDWTGAAGVRYRMDLFLQEGGPSSVSFQVKVTHPR